MDALRPKDLAKTNNADLINALRNFAQSASNTVSENVSAPVDAIAWALRKAGMPVNKPIMGSDWMREKGLTAPVQEGVSKVAGDTLGMISPLGLTKQGAQAMIDVGGKMKNIPVGNMFIGETAKTWDEVAAAQAKMMEKQGKTPQQIWKDTGTFKGPDGKYRQEISDNMAKYDPDALKELKANDSFNYLKDTQPLAGVVEHSDLYKAYPSLENVPVHFMPQSKMGDAYGAYAPKLDRLTLSDSANPKNYTKNSLHEMQHAVQQREGFSQGGNLKGLSLDEYSRLAGEAEARATQARMNMTAKQRRDVFPYDSYDVPINELIVK